jgi:hypothetical protein
LWTILFFACHIAGYAQEKQQTPFLVPQIVYVGDRATLVIPLPGKAQASAKDSGLSLESSGPRFSSLGEIEIHRAVLERRAAGSRLVVEFSAYMPGVLELPPVEIGGEIFSGITVTVHSILGTGADASLLSDPAAALAVPGTGLLVYGSLGAFAFALLLALWLIFRGRRLLKQWTQRWKRRRLIFYMGGIEKRLRKILQKEGNRREILAVLSAEFRVFLSFFSGENCRAMTASESARLPPVVPEAAEKPRGDFLGAFFRHCDELRFQGGDISNGDVSALLCDLRAFLESLENAERKKHRQEEKAA